MLSGTNHDPCINFEPSPLVVQLIKLEFETPIRSPRSDTRHPHALVFGTVYRESPLSQGPAAVVLSNVLRNDSSQETCRAWHRSQQCSVEIAQVENGIAHSRAR
jgi:hypothetical protein